MEAFEQSDLWALSCNLGMLPTQYKSWFPAQRKKGATKELMGLSPGPGQVLTIVDGNSAMAERREGAAIMGLEDKVSKVQQCRKLVLPYLYPEYSYKSQF